MKFDKFHLMINGAGVVILLTVVTYIVRSFFLTNAVEVCSARYQSTTTFEYVNELGVLSPIEMQARASGREWGLLTNAVARELQSGPATAALEVKFVKGSGTRAEGEPVRSGVSFDWAPGEFGRQSAACLKYSIWVADDFDFGQSGNLPGLYGTVTNGSADDIDTGFAAPVIWRTEGTPYVAPRIPSDPKSKVVYDFARTMPRGKWVEIEEEVVLNTPGAADGRLRVFLDGKMKINQGGFNWRADEATRIIGVRSEVSFDLNAPKDQTLILSPLELRW